MSHNDTQDVLLARQAILDRDQQMHAYELLFRGHRTNEAGPITDDLAATASVINHTFSDLGLEAVLGPYLGFLNVDAKLLHSELIEILPPSKVVLELLETIEITEDIVMRCAMLKQMGFTLALDDVVCLNEAQAGLLKYIDIVKIDVFDMSKDDLRDLVLSLRRWPVKLLAEKIDTQDMADYCKELGFDLFQGYFYAKPRLIEGKKLSPSEAALLRLLGLVSKDAESNEIENVLRNEPVLMLNLIRLTNSVGAGTRAKITSIRQAITVLGRRQLMRWIQLLLYTSVNNPDSKPSPLLITAATRARCMELLRGRLPDCNAESEDRAFMTGILSLMPAVMGIAMEQIIEPLNLADTVRDALLHRAGQLGHLLLLMERLENDDPTRLADAMEQLPELTPAQVREATEKAMAWAGCIGASEESKPAAKPANTAAALG